jgi:hypothetical protein
MMTTSITRPQADALAALIRTLRPEWDIPGIVRALSEARDRGSAFELSIDPLHIAWSVTAERPGIVTEPGQGAPNVGGLVPMGVPGFGLAQEGAA